jgi:purine-binding chemotaxis protein CheW
MKHVTAVEGDLVTLIVGGQLFGIPVLQVRDVLGAQRLTRIPLAPAEIAGSLNLRGRIVTAIDLRVRLGLAQTAEQDERMSVVVEHSGELYSLLVDTVGEVLTVDPARCEQNPGTLDSFWRDVSAGICKLDNNLLVVLDVDRLLVFAGRRADAA